MAASENLFPLTTFSPKPRLATLHREADGDSG